MQSQSELRTSPVLMSRKGPLKWNEPIGVAHRGMLDFVEDCGKDVTLH